MPATNKVDKAVPWASNGGEHKASAKVCEMIEHL